MPDGPLSSREASGARYLQGDIIDGKYRLIRPIGEGGMGVVWLGHNVVLNVDVAVKLIHTVGGNTSVLAKRFLQEARTAAQLAHPAICRVFDYGQTHLGDPFIVSEFLEGETLADRIDNEGRLPGPLAVQTILPVVGGLAVAHATGIVHRDVKSENIFLARDLTGRVQPKLLDFGVARFVHDDSKITVEGCLLGTPDYMSPEQARGETGCDFRTDIWSLCVVLYELLTARTPFLGENYNAVMWSILHDEIKPVTQFGAGNSSLWKLIEQGLRKDPLERWGSMRELGRALASWLYERGAREDLCGASLRATWLEVTSSRELSEPLPATSSFPPSETVEAATSHGSDEAPPEPRGRNRMLLDRTKETLPGLEAQRGSLRHAPRPRWIALTAALGALGLVALGVWIGTAFNTQPAGAVPSLEPRPVPRRLGTAAIRAASAPTASPSFESPSVTPSSLVTASAKAPVSRVQPPVVRVQAHRGAKPKPAKKLDFGF